MIFLRRPVDMGRRRLKQIAQATVRSLFFRKGYDLVKLKTNLDKVAMISVMGKIQHPIFKPGQIYRVGYDGIGRIVPHEGGITYDVEIGDGCMDLVADHVEPGASARNPDTDESVAFTHFSCVGNEAVVVTGDAKGAKGFVTGKNGNCSHVLFWFKQEDLHKMAPDDRIMVKSRGLGLALSDYPDVQCMSLDPDLLDKIAVDMEERDGKLYVPVVTVIPARCMGDGLGRAELFGGDYDIMTRDPKTYAQCHMDKLRFGDLVYIQDNVNYYGPDYLEGAGSFGVIVHGDSKTCGNGPGVTVLLTSGSGAIQPKLCKHANIAHYLGTKKCD